MVSNRLKLNEYKTATGNSSAELAERHNTVLERIVSTKNVLLCRLTHILIQLSKEGHLIKSIKSGVNSGVNVAKRSKTSLEVKR